MSEGAPASRVASAPGPAATKPPRGWSPEPWRLRMTLLYARQRFPYASASGRLLDGVERWTKLTGRGQIVGSAWWAHAVALVAVAASAVADEPTSRLLAPWVGSGAATAGAGFRVVGVDAEAEAG